MVSEDDTSAQSATNLRLLGEEWSRWAAVTATLSDDEWRRPTRCEGWDVKALATHVSQGIRGLDALVTKRRAEGPIAHATAAELLQSVMDDPDERMRISDVNASRALQDAASTSNHELQSRFADMAPAAIAAALARPGMLVDYFGRGTVPLGAAVTIRLAEAVIHLLDVANALDRAIDESSPQSMRQASLFYLDMTPTVAWIEVASGRREPDDLFPVHA